MNPHCDLATGKVYGCKKGSRNWWHEKGHFEFNNNHFYSLLILLKGYLRDIWLFYTMISIIYNQLWLIAFIFWLIYFSIFIYEELWCEHYAWKHFKKKIA